MSQTIDERSGSAEVNDRPVAPDTNEHPGFSRRAILRAGAIGAGVAGVAAANSLLAPNLAGRGLWSPDGVFGAASIAWADAIYTGRSRPAR